MAYTNAYFSGDVDGSVEAILEIYETYKSEKCQFDVVTFGIGPITENDLELAELAKGMHFIIYFLRFFNSPFRFSKNLLLQRTQSAYDRKTSSSEKYRHQARERHL